MRVKRVLGIIGAVVLVVVPAYVGLRVYKHWHYPQWHASVVPGDTEQIVRGKMGSPDMVNVPPDWCTDAAREFMYGNPIPPEWWVVGFDKSGKVNCTTRLVSP